MTDEQRPSENYYSTEHPHGPEIKEALDSEGRCRWCGDTYRLSLEVRAERTRADAAEAQRDRLAAALTELHADCAAVDGAAARYNEASYREEDGAWLLGKDNPHFAEHAMAEGKLKATMAKVRRLLDEDARAALADVPEVRDA